MNLIEINENIKNLLAGLDYNTLPNLPNISGFNEQSTITFIIGSGTYVDDNYVDLELRISIAATLRTEEENADDDLSNFINEEISRNLDELITTVISIFHNRPLFGTKPVTFKSFEISPPQSGKWRALLLFTVPTRITSNYENEIEGIEPTIQTIENTYIYEALNYEDL